MFSSAFRGRRVLVTGHTGFKGAWLCEWLLQLDAEVYGFAKAPEPYQTLFDSLQLHGRLASDSRGDINDARVIGCEVERIRPDFVFHLAAQPLVRSSYDAPITTFATNVMGTAHVLDAIRSTGRPCTLVCVTTDKCYHNREWDHSYREDDAMGGHDPYSASKGAAELVIASYRRSFFNGATARVASARAGNVVGGGDWSPDRIVPDCMRSILAGESIAVRNPNATRPWQHVLEPLSGYLSLAAAMASEAAAAPRLHALTAAFNFGPPLTGNRSVKALVLEILRHADGRWHDAGVSHGVHEAGKLNLATDRAFHLLHWQPVWSFEKAIEQTVGWYVAHNSAPDSALALTRSQITEYVRDASALGLRWALNEG